MTPAELDAELRTVLRRLEMTSGAPTQAFDSSGSRSTEHPGGKRPAGDETSPADHYRRRLQGVGETHTHKLEQALDDHARDLATLWWCERAGQILADATSELAQITGRDGLPPRRHDGELDTAEGIADAIAEDAPGKPARMVAERLGLGVHLVNRTYIRELGLDPLDGSPAIGRLESTAGRVRRLAQEGKTQKQIATLMGCSQPTVSRYLRSAA